MESLPHSSISSSSLYNPNPNPRWIIKSVEAVYVADVVQLPRGAGGDHINTHVAYQSAYKYTRASKDHLCISNDMIAAIMLPVKPEDK